MHNAPSPFGSAGLTRCQGGEFYSGVVGFTTGADKKAQVKNLNDSGRDYLSNDWAIVRLFR
jgi:hypothetical protein